MQRQAKQPCTGKEAYNTGKWQNSDFNNIHNHNIKEKKGKTKQILTKKIQQIKEKKKQALLIPEANVH